MKKLIASLLFCSFYGISLFAAQSPLERLVAIVGNNPSQVTGLEHLAEKAEIVPQVTIWVHATKFVGFASDFIHATPRSGLMHISEFPWNYRLKNLLETLNSADPRAFPREHMYAFGWSGSLSFEERLKEGGNLYRALKVLIPAYKNKYGVEPHITFITHSHGGNVVLNIPNFIEKDFKHKATAIFLGIPVQKETKEIIHNPFFERIYSFYSHNDWIQAGDPQGFYINNSNNERHWEFSERTFCGDKKLSQAHLKINGEGIWHLGYIREYFVSILPRLVQELDLWEDQSPSSLGQERVLSVNYY
jgi:hypothetical protein